MLGEGLKEDVIAKLDVLTEPDADQQVVRKPSFPHVYATVLCYGAFCVSFISFPAYSSKVNYRHFVDLMMKDL